MTQLLTETPTEAAHAAALKADHLERDRGSVEPSASPRPLRMFAVYDRVSSVLGCESRVMLAKVSCGRDRPALAAIAKPRGARGRSHGADVVIVTPSITRACGGGKASSGPIPERSNDGGRSRFRLSAVRQRSFVPSPVDATNARACAGPPRRPESLNRTAGPGDPALPNRFLCARSGRFWAWSSRLPSAGGTRRPSRCPSCLRVSSATR